MGEAYSGFAAVYDLFMSDIPYEEWAAYVTDLLKERGIRDGLLLELGCGTGTFTRLLADAGYDMIGVDSSVEMLEEAAAKTETWKRKTEEAEDPQNPDILYLCQDMREFELYGTVRAVVSVCDSMNYITEEEDLKQVFSLVNNYLDPGGVFIFDLKTDYFFREITGDCVMAENREEASFIWENAYYEEEQMNEYDLTLFIRQPDGYFERTTETHLQRAYDIETVKRLLEEAHLQVEAVYDAFTKEAPVPESQRIYFVAREKDKKV